MGKWISVEERLPEENVSVLVSREWGSLAVATMWKPSDKLIAWVNEDDECDYEDVLAWMPLPEPYKKEH